GRRDARLLDPGVPLQTGHHARDHQSGRTDGDAAGDVPRRVRGVLRPGPHPHALHDQSGLSGGVPPVAAPPGRRTVTAVAAHAAPMPARSGVVAWVTTTDHKRIGILYIVTTIGFFLVAGVLALIIRAQLSEPGLHLVGR